MDQLDFLKPSKRNRQKRRDKRLSEELIECRRGNGGDRNKKLREKNQSKKVYQDINSETPRIQSSIRDNRGDTYQTDNLEPLLRFLQSHVGQPWDKVYAKLSQQLDKRSALGLHVFEHLFDFVDIHTQIKNGKLIRYDRYGDEFQYWSYRWRRFYVHPTSKLLGDSYHKNPKGPYPKKARWKKAKQKLKSKIRQGIPAKVVTRHHYQQVRTHGKNLIEDRIYDLRISDKDQESRCRVKLIKIHNVKEGLKLSVQVLKSALQQKKGTIVLSSKAIENRHRYHPNKIGHFYNWKIFDTGTYYFDPKNQKDSTPFFILRQQGYVYNFTQADYISASQG